MLGVPKPLSGRGNRAHKSFCGQQNGRGRRRPMRHHESGRASSRRSRQRLDLALALDKPAISYLGIRGAISVLVYPPSANTCSRSDAKASHLLGPWTRRRHVAFGGTRSRRHRAAWGVFGKTDGSPQRALVFGTFGQGVISFENFGSASYGRRARVRSGRSQYFRSARCLSNGASASCDWNIRLSRARSPLTAWARRASDLGRMAKRLYLAVRRGRRSCNGADRCGSSSAL